MDEHFYDQSVANAYAPLKQTGSFLGGVMPMIPPKTEWCTFDF
jgi:nucleoporin NUP42